MAVAREIQTNFSTTNVTLTTTAETVIISSGAARVPKPTATIIIFAWAQLTTGAAATGVTPRIRRGTTTSGTLVGEANVETLKAAAGSIEPFFALVTEDRENEESVEYSLTLSQTAATGNGTSVQAGIVVIVL